MGACQEPEPGIPDPAVLGLLDEFWQLFMRNRSLCGYMPVGAIGMSHFFPGGYYGEVTPYERIVFKEPVTPESRAYHNAIATWNNENFMLRLWAILESNGFTKPIRESAASAEYVKLLKRLRQHFGHGSGRFDQSKADHLRLRRKLIELFPAVASSEGIALSIDTVLEPMRERCYEYAEDVLRRKGDAPV